MLTATLMGPSFFPTIAAIHESPATKTMPSTRRRKEQATSSPRQATARILQPMTATVVACRPLACTVKVDA